MFRPVAILIVTALWSLSSPISTGPALAYAEGTVSNYDDPDSLSPPSFEELESTWQSEFFRKNGISISALEESCASIASCKDCTSTYTCHWCESDRACHAKASPYGCKWGGSCPNDDDDNDDNKKKDGNSTSCASYTTCSDCALASRVCHWCESDNACHAKGSPYGCMTGVDCYSNDRCRRKEPEKFPHFVITEIPMSRLVIVLVVATVLILACSCCHFCIVGNVKGAYDDLATLAMMQRNHYQQQHHQEHQRPPSVIGGPVMQSINHPGNDRQSGETSTPTATATAVAGKDGNVELVSDVEEAIVRETVERPPDPPSDDHMQQLQGTGGETNDENNYLLMEGDGDAQIQEFSPLLISPRSVDAVLEEPKHMKALYKICSFVYYLFVIVIVLLTIIVILFYPKRPVYNVCNDALAWTNIFKKIASFQLDLGFEILISLSNPNRLDVALDNATGRFTFEGNPVGTFMIPPENITSMAITDLMLIAHVTPDRAQAVKMADAYWNGNLILVSEFNATVRVPSLMNFTKNVHVENITVYVNELSDRSLCSCPSWDDHKEGGSFFSFF